MSEYKVFVKEFPLRCEKIMGRIEKGHKYEDLTVTGLLMVAASAIIIPYERLRPVPDHPSGDAKKYTEAAEKFKQLLDSNFVGSDLCSPNDKAKWLFAKAESVEDDPDRWKWTFKKEISKEKKTKGVLDIIRNALAHGNIFTKPSRGDIQEIIFVSQELKRGEDGKVKEPHELKHYNCISVTPSLFKQFLGKWFAYIKNLEIYPYVIDDFKEVA